MPEKDDLDLLLGSALATYADPGPESGLEDRILAALAAGEASPVRSRPRRRWLPWTIAIPAVGLLLLWLALPKAMHAPATVPQIARQLAGPTQSAPAAPAPEIARKPGSGPRHLPHSTQPGQRTSVVESVRKAPPPKLDIFPTPQPLTAEERALAAAATTAPDPTRQALMATQKQPDAPLSIADLEIPPLVPPDGGKN